MQQGRRGYPIFLLQLWIFLSTDLRDSYPRILYGPHPVSLSTGLLGSKYPLKYNFYFDEIKI